MGCPDGLLGSRCLSTACCCPASDRAERALPNLSAGALLSHVLLSPVLPDVEHLDSNNDGLSLECKSCTCLVLCDERYSPSRRDSSDLVLSQQLACRSAPLFLLATLRPTRKAWCACWETSGRTMHQEQWCVNPPSSSYETFCQMAWNVSVACIVIYLRPCFGGMLWLLLKAYRQST